MSVFGSDRGPKQSPALPETQSKQTVNIFTVASGHMYERLQKIMILSVLRHTSAPVKFWFIKNYMSPQMKVGALAASARAIVRLARSNAHPDVCLLPATDVGW